MRLFFVHFVPDFAGFVPGLLFLVFGYYAVNVLSSYKSSMKSPDSLTIKDNIFYFADSDGQYLVFTVSGTNGFGDTVTETPIYKGHTYYADLNDDVGSIDSKDVRQHIIMFRVWISNWDGTPEISSESIIRAADEISGKRVASKVHCKWEG